MERDACGVPVRVVAHGPGRCARDSGIGLLRQGIPAAGVRLVDEDAISTCQGPGTFDIIACSHRSGQQDELWIILPLRGYRPGHVERPDHGGRQFLKVEPASIEAAMIEAKHAAIVAGVDIFLVRCGAVLAVEVDIAIVRPPLRVFERAHRLRRPLVLDGDRVLGAPEDEVAGRGALLGVAVRQPAGRPAAVLVHARAPRAEPLPDVARVRIHRVHGRPLLRRVDHCRVLANVFARVRRELLELPHRQAQPLQARVAAGVVDVDVAVATGLDDPEEVVFWPRVLDRGLVGAVVRRFHHGVLHLERPARRARAPVARVDRSIDGRQQQEILNLPVLQRPRLEQRRRVRGPVGLLCRVWCSNGGVARRSQGCDGALPIGIGQGVLHVFVVVVLDLGLVAVPLGGMQGRGGGIALAQVRNEAVQEELLLLRRSNDGRQEEDAGRQPRDGEDADGPPSTRHVEVRADQAALDAERGSDKRCPTPEPVICKMPSKGIR